MKKLELRLVHHTPVIVEQVTPANDSLDAFVHGDFDRSAWNTSLPPYMGSGLCSARLVAAGRLSRLHNNNYGPMAPPDRPLQSGEGLSRYRPWKHARSAE